MKISILRKYSHLIFLAYISFFSPISAQTDDQLKENQELKTQLSIFQTRPNGYVQGRKYFLDKGGPVAIPQLLNYLKENCDSPLAPSVAQAISLLRRESNVSDKLQTEIRMVYLMILDQSLNTGLRGAVLRDLPNFDRSNSKGVKTLLKIGITNPDLAPNIARQLKPMGNGMAKDLVTTFRYSSDDLRYNLTEAFSSSIDSKHLTPLEVFLQARQSPWDKLAVLRLFPRIRLTADTEKLCEQLL